VVEALCFSRGEQRFSVAEKSWTLMIRFSAGLENPGLKPVLSEMNRFSAGLKSSSPLLKQGAPTRFGVDYIGGSFSGSHPGAKSPIQFAYSVGAEAHTYQPVHFRRKNFPQPVKPVL
jgi:hypothetical protein